MTTIDIESAAARQILKLNKKDVTKRLQVAVRDTQGGKRASWAPNDRPLWWREKYVLSLPNGEEVESLQFASQGKSYWQVERARVTLLLFENRDALNEDSEDAKEVTVAHGEAPSHAVESPKLVKIDESENVPPNVPDESACSLTTKEPSREEPVGPKRRTKRRSQAKQRRKQVPQKESPQTMFLTLSDDEGAIVVKKTGPSKSVTAEAVAEGRGAITVANDNPDPIEQTEQQDSGDDEVEITDAAAQQARMERIAAIDAEEAELTKQLNKGLADFRLRCNKRVKAIRALRDNEITKIASAHHIFKMKQTVLDMPMAEYVKDYNADAHERLLKDASRRARRVFEENNFSKDFGDYTAPAPNAYAQARRDEVTATARKATRAARLRQIEFAVPTTSLRSRPQRSAAKTSAYRTQAILQGSAIRGQPLNQSVRRRTTRAAAATPAAMKTPALAGNPIQKSGLGMGPLLASIRKLPNRRECLVLLESIRKHPNPHELVAQACDELRAELDQDSQ